MVWVEGGWVVWVEGGWVGGLRPGGWWVVDCAQVGGGGWWVGGWVPRCPATYGRPAHPPPPPTNPHTHAHCSVLACWPMARHVWQSRANCQRACAAAAGCRGNEGRWLAASLGCPSLCPNYTTVWIFYQSGRAYPARPLPHPLHRQLGLRKGREAAAAPPHPLPSALSLTPPPPLCCALLRPLPCPSRPPTCCALPAAAPASPQSHHHGLQKEAAWVLGNLAGAPSRAGIDALKEAGAIPVSGCACDPGEWLWGRVCARPSPALAQRTVNPHKAMWAGG